MKCKRTQLLRDRRCAVRRCRAAIRAARQKYTDEQVRQVEAALENPFDSGEIKWRVTTRPRTDAGAK